MNIFTIFAEALVGRRTSRIAAACPATPASELNLKERGGTIILRGPCWVIDGDTIIIKGVRIRLAGIDAPELDHPWGRKSKWTLVSLCKGQTVIAHVHPELSYNRLVAQCFLSDGRDLAAEMVRFGMAIDWPKFSGGAYRGLERTDARRRLWRADLRQQGRLGFSPAPRPAPARWRRAGPAHKQSGG